MKIVQINSVCGQGSTGRIAVDIAIEVERRGHVCYIAYGHGNTDYQRSYKIGNRFEHLLHNILFSRLLGLQGYGSIVSTLKFVKWLKKIKPDIIHIHNLHANYINYRILFKYIISRKLPVIFTLHDCLNFTGKCTYFTANSCNKWKQECHKCPLYHKSGVPSIFFDWSRKMFRDKKMFYSRIERCKTIAVSKWLKEIAFESILNCNGHSVSYIYNWIDHRVFKPADKEEIERFYQKYDLPRDKRYLISVSQEWDMSATRTEDALAIAEKLPDDYYLILVGRMNRSFELPKNIIHIPYRSSQMELAIAYSLADVYVHLSIQDTFGLVIGEAMACGTIPVTYNSTACSETPSSFGIVVPPRDINAIINSLSLIESKKARRLEMIEFVKNTYDKTINIGQYIETYTEIVQNEI